MDWPMHSVLQRSRYGTKPWIQSDNSFVNLNIGNKRKTTRHHNVYRDPLLRARGNDSAAAELNLFVRLYVWVLSLFFPYRSTYF